MSVERILSPAPSFSLEERDRRYANVRRLMRERDLAALIFPHATGDWDNLQVWSRYMSCVGGSGTATALIFPLEGDPIVAVREPRRVDWWRQAQDWVRDIRAPKGVDWSRFFAEGLNDLGLAAARIGVVGLDNIVREPQGIVPYQEFVALQKALSKATFVSATDIMDVVRKRKSAEEIRMVERAQVCSDAISRVIRETPRPGMWLHELMADITAGAIRTGCEMPSMFLLGCSPVIYQTHLHPEFRQIEADDVLMLEAEPKFFGYMSQSVETVAMRKFTDKERAMLAASKVCFAAICDAMKPGGSYRDIVTLWNKTAKSEGWQPGRSMGHGLGLGQDRPWTTTTGLSFDTDMPVEEGDCMVIKPWVADEDDRVSVRYGGIVVVEQSGARRLGTVQSEPIELTSVT